MGQRAILHIGTPKTGTTSIQSVLAERRDALHACGFHFATAPGHRNHIALAGYGAGEGYAGNALRRAGGAGDGAALGPRLARAIADEVAALPPHIHTVLFSSEQLATRLDGPAEIARLKSLLDPCFTRFEIVVYLRRQDEVAVSKYSTSLRAGGETDAAILPTAGREGLLYRLCDIVENWAAVFGRDAMRPRLFDRGALIDGDVVADFLATVGLGDLPRDAEKPASNPAISAAAQEMVRRFNALVVARGLADRPRLGPHMRDPVFQGRPRLPARSAAEAFLARFAAGNEQLRAAYFPDRKQLFSDDFSRYPEAADAAGVLVPAADAVLDAAMEMLLRVAEALRAAEVEALARDAREAEAAGRDDETRRRWTKVLRAEHQHREALKAIATLDGGTSAPNRERPQRAERAARKTQRRATNQARRAAPPAPS